MSGYSRQTQVVIVKLSDYSCKCLRCKSVLNFECVGKAALQQHAKSKIHRTVADMRKNRNAAQIVFAAKDEENNDNNQTSEERIEDTSEVSDT